MIDYKKLCSSCLWFTLVFVFFAQIGTLSAAPPPWSEGGPSAPEDIRVTLITFSPGDAVPSWFGHTALLVEDTKRRQSRVYNYGMFSFGRDMLMKFLMGRLEFWVADTSTQGTYNFYKRENRHIRLQELNFSPAKSMEAAKYLASNVLPENRNYLYHHYWDNCSTRPRDVIDKVVDGQFKKASERPGRFTLREHTRRHSQQSPYIDFLLSAWMTDEIDQTIPVWEEMFLPEELEKEIDAFSYVDENGKTIPIVRAKSIQFKAERGAAPATPRTVWPWAFLVGLLLGGFGLVLGRKKRVRTLGVYHFFIGIFIGIPGLAVLLFNFTEHTITHMNENMFFMNPLLFLALLLSPFIVLKKRFALKWMSLAWWLLAIGAVVGLLVKVLPWFDQGNWEVIAFFLPFNILMAVAVDGLDWVYRSQKLRKINDSIWVAECNHLFYGLTFGARMTVIKLADGKLAIVSPISCDEALRKEVEEVGEVAYLIAPNRYHHVYIGEWMEAFPDADSFAAPGLQKKRKDLKFDHVLGETEVVAELESLVIDGCPEMGEVVFFHGPSKTLVVTDFIIRLKRGENWRTALYLKLSGSHGKMVISLSLRPLYRDKAAAKASAERLLELDFDTVVMAHGVVCTDGAKAEMTNAMKWLKPHQTEKNAKT